MRINDVAILTPYFPPKPKQLCYIFHQRILRILGLA